MKDKEINIAVTFESLIKSMSTEATVDFIRALDETAQDWQVTKECTKYFLDEMLKEPFRDRRGNVGKTKKIYKTMYFEDEK